MTTDPSSDVLERLRVATADPWRLHMPDGAMLLHCDIVEALATIERLSAERMQLREAVKPLADSVLPHPDTIGGWRFGTRIPHDAAYRAHELLYGPNEFARADCAHCGQSEASHEPSGCCGDGGGSVFARGIPGVETMSSEPCPQCDDSGYIEIAKGGVWTGEDIRTCYEICDCPCGDDVRRDRRQRSA